METMYDRPVRGSLIMRLDNGEEWVATPEDLAKLNLVTRHDAYMAFNDALESILRSAGLLTDRQDLTDAKLNPLRFLVSQTVAREDFAAADHADVADIERRLQSFEPPPVPDLPGDVLVPDRRVRDA